MNARWLAVLVVVSMLPVSTGCGSIKHLLFGAGAACGSCAARGPACGGAPAYAGPAAGCGAPACGAVQGGECGCGGEYGSAYLGAMDQGYSLDGTIIGNPVYGSGIYDGVPVESYNQNEWYPSVNVPGTVTQPVAPMAPAPGR